jgi:putative ABC transport system permease protein
METFLQDIRYAVRMLLKKPGFTAVTVLTLALGIGANTAIFTVVDAALLRSLPYREPDRLVHLWETNQQQEFHQREASYPDYLTWKEQNHSFDQMAGYSRGSFTLTGRDMPERIQGAAVTASFFSVLGVEAIRGRTFYPDEDKPGGENVVILSHALWERRFGGDAGIIGQSITLGGRPFTVIGILPPHFKFALAGEADLWIALRPTPMQVERHYMHWLNVVARLKPGVSPEQARSDMKAVAARIAERDQQYHSGSDISVVELQEQMVGAVKPVLIVLLAAVGFVLLIACANVANLLLARSAARRKEMAIRTALGASRLRIIRQLLTESLLLALLGGALGLVVAVWGIELLVAAIPRSILASMPYLDNLAIDSGVLGFTCAITLATGLVFGLAPALQASKPGIQETLKDGSRSSTDSARHRVRIILVVSEIALAMVLLVGAGLMLKSLLRLLEVDTGFDSRNLLTMQLALPAARYSEAETRAAFHQQLLARIESLPGVKGAATVSVLPLVGGDTGGFNVEGEPAVGPGEKRESNLRTVSSGYFQVMGIPLIKGRYFTDFDNRNGPNVVIINQTLADRFFPGQEPVGKRIIFTFGQPVPQQIVGIVGDEKVVSLDARTTPVIYAPYLSDLDSLMGIVVRADSDPDSLAAAVRGEVAALDRDLPIYGVQTMERMIAESPSTFLRRYPALLIGLFAVVAAALAVIGIYGVVSYSVAQRTHEIGIRMALGASKRDILKLVVGQAAGLMAAGVGGGLVAAFAVTRLMASLLYGVSATDPVTFASVSVLLAAVALLASYVPARRAAKTDPMVALRYE